MILDYNGIPQDLNLKIVQSKYPLLSSVITVLSNIIMFCAPLLISRAGQTTLNISNDIAIYFVYAFFASIAGVYIGYLLEKKYLSRGEILISCETDTISINDNEMHKMIRLSSLERIIYDPSSVKGENSINKFSSSGAQNYISLVSPEDLIKIEVLVTTKDESELAKQIVFYHNTRFRR